MYFLARTLVLLALYRAVYTLVVTPNNTALLDGESVVLPCRSDLGLSTFVSWSRKVNGRAEESIVSGCYLYPEFSSIYTIINDGRGQCDLIVNRTNTSLTGLYSCVELAGHTALAHLTIIDTTVHISQFPHFVVQGELTYVSCLVSYSGLLAPTFIWRPISDNIVTPINTGNAVRSTIQVPAPAYPDSVPIFTCYVTFNGSIFPSAHNQTSSQIKTSVCVQSATITGAINGTALNTDSPTVITCTADTGAYPSPSYRWTNHIDGSESAGPQFVLQPGVNYKLSCNASNNFNKPGCYAAVYVEFNSTYSSAELLILGLSLGIGIPVVICILILFILIICCCCSCCPMYEKCCTCCKQSKLRTSGDLYNVKDNNSQPLSLGNLQETTKYEQLNEGPQTPVYDQQQPSETGPGYYYGDNSHDSVKKDTSQAVDDTDKNHTYTEISE